MADSDKQPMQAMGKPGADTPDGVNNAPSGGESSGAAYPNPHDDSDEGRFEGGQSLKDYHGGPGGEDNQAKGTD
jgi:hypothetical protein